MTRIDLWLKGLLADAISGGAGGVLTGFAPVDIFNLQAGVGMTLGNYVWGTMFAWRATSCQRPCCFIQMPVNRRFSAFPAFGI